VFEFHEEEENFYVVMECIKGGALFDRIKERKTYTEVQARDLTLVLLRAIKHIHDHDVVHRDLKPENLLMTSDDHHADVKIADFGFAAENASANALQDRCGTPMYVAPEILTRQPHGKPADMWSFGVILFLLLSGEAPFKDAIVQRLYAKIKAGRLVFGPSWRCVSAGAADLVRSLLTTDQRARATVEQALAHGWFTTPAAELPGQNLTGTIEGIRSFQAPLQRFKAGVFAVEALGRMMGTLTRAQYIAKAAALPLTLEARYTLAGELGRGGYAVVYAACSKIDQRAVAVKSINREGLKPSTVLGIRREVEILASLHHRSVVRSFDFIETPTRFYVVMEQVQGGELFDRILKKKHYTEKEARDLVVVLLTAIKHCHDNRIAHRDLKPENLLMTSKEDDADLKLVDFGFAARCEGNSLTNQCGTPAYVAPEIVRKQPHGVGVDMWSFGVILYILLCGYPPFRDKVEKSLFAKIRAGCYEFHTKYWDKVSEDAKDLVRRLLVVDPSCRLTADEALAHPWVAADSKTLSSYDLSSSLSELELFQGAGKFKAGVNAVLAIHKMRHLLVESPEDSEGSVPSSPMRVESPIGVEAGALPTSPYSPSVAQMGVAGAAEAWAATGAVGAATIAGGRKNPTSVSPSPGGNEPRMFSLSPRGIRAGTDIAAAPRALSSGSVAANVAASASASPPPAPAHPQGTREAPYSSLSASSSTDTTSHIGVTLSLSSAELFQSRDAQSAQAPSGRSIPLSPARPPHPPTSNTLGIPSPHAPANAGGIAAGSISAELREEMEQMQLTGEMQEMGEMQEVGEMQQMEGHRDPQSKKK